MSVFDGLPSLAELWLPGPAGQVHYWDTGDPSSPSGPPIALLPGTGGSAEAHFVDLLPMLAFRRRVIAIDYAPPASHRARLSTYADTVAAVLDRCDVPVAVVGHSLGAAVATTLAASRPDLTASLVLVAGWLATDVDQRLRHEISLRLWESDREALASHLVFTGYGSTYLNRRTPRELEALVAAVRQRIDANPAWRDQMHLNRALDITREADALTSPSLVVGARLDRTAPLHHSRLLFGAIADARYVEVACGHSVPLERPAELHWLIEQFTSDPSATPTGSVWESRPLRLETSQGSVELELPQQASGDRAPGEARV